MANVTVEPSTEFPVANSRTPTTDPTRNAGMKGFSDEDLVARSLNGEDDAFRCLYERYRLPVYTAAYRIVMDPEEAWDTTQEVFMTAHRSLAVWDPKRGKFLSWIYRIATNSAIDHWRTRHRRAEVPLDELSEKQNNVPSLCRSKAALIERTVEHRERIAEVRRFLETLPQLHKRLVVLRYFAGLKLKEIAEKEGCKIGTVKSVLHRATHTLRLKLMRFYEQRQINFQDIPL